MSVRNFLTFIFLSAAIISPKNSISENKINTLLSSEIMQLYSELSRLPFDNLPSALVDSLVIQRDRGRLTFKTGTFYLVKPVLGKVTAAVFLGDGVFELKPPTKIERQQVLKFLDKDSLHENFSAAYLRFTDSTAHELKRQLSFHVAKAPKAVGKLHKIISKIFLEERGLNIASEILTDFVNNSEGNLFSAFLEHTDPDLNFPNYYIFTVNNHAFEEVSVSQFFPKSYNKLFYTVCSFHKQSDYDGGQLPDEEQSGESAAFKITRYKMNLDLKKNGKIKAEVDLSFITKIDSLRILTFDIFKEFKIDSVKNSVGEILLFIKEKKQSSFSVILKKAVQAQVTEKVTVFFSGKVLKRVNNNFVLKNNIFWYPRYGYLVPATYDLTFQYPRNYQVVSTGKKIKEWSSKNVSFSHWVEEDPVLGAAFGFGKFDFISFDTKDSLTVKVYSTPNRKKKVIAKVADDVTKSLKNFQNLLGEYPYRELKIVETPTQLSYGFPGLVFLSALSFTREPEGVMEALRGHEVAHQWWGNLVGWQTYHDQWLSEALAVYSGAIMTQFILEEDEIFFQILEGWRNDLLNKGHIGVSAGLHRFGFSKQDLSKSDGLKAGPIWLGRRLGEKFPIDYYLITYEKGAYVIHMLRTLMRDFETGSDEKFWLMLADFVKTYKGTRASTLDFKKIVEKHTGQNMNWFFEQWIYGIDVPTYTYSYDIFKKGEYWVDLQVSQTDVPADFKMLIPVTVQTDNEKKNTRLIDMEGAKKFFRLGPFKSQPQKVTFNAFDGVLARVRLK